MSADVRPEPWVCDLHGPVASGDCERCDDEMIAFEEFAARLDAMLAPEHVTDADFDFEALEVPDDASRCAAGVVTCSACDTIGRNTFGPMLKRIAAESDGVHLRVLGEPMCASTMMRANAGIGV